MSDPVARIQLDSGISFVVYPTSLPMLIGRDDDCDLCLPVPSISRRHCLLYLVNNVLCLKDTSTNGTAIGDRLIKQESFSIQKPTKIGFAGEVNITVVPVLGGLQSEDDRQFNKDRRFKERRASVARTQEIVIDFERRQCDDRRMGERRASA